MVNLPRQSRAGAVDNDLGNLDLFDCSDRQEGEYCQFKSPSADELSNPTNPQSVGSYGESVALYSVFAIVCALLLPACGCCFCAYRTWWICCCCRYGICGKGVPTQRSAKVGIFSKLCCCGACGFVENENGRKLVERTGQTPRGAGALAGKSSTPTVTPGTPSGTPRGGTPRGGSKKGNAGRDGVLKQHFSYPRTGRLFARSLMVLFSVFTMIFAFVGINANTAKLEQGVSGMASAADGGAELVRSLGTPVSNLVFNAASQVINPLFINLNNTINDNVDLDNLIGSADCLLDVIDTSLPNTTVLRGFVKEVNGSVYSLLDAATTLRGGVQDIDAVLVGLDASLASTDAILGEVQTAQGSLQTNIADAAEALRNATSDLASLTNPSTGVGSVASDLSAYIGNRTAPADVRDVSDYYQGFISTQLHGHNATGQVYRTDAIAASEAIIAAINNYPDFSALADKLVAVNNTLNAVQARGSIPAAIASLDGAQASINAIPDVSRIKGALQLLEGNVSAISLDGVIAGLEGYDEALKGIPSFDVLRGQLDRILGLQGIIACVDMALVEAERVNASLVALPDSILDSIYEVRDTANSTISDAVDQINDLNGTLVDAEETIDGLPQAQGYLDDMHTLEESLVDPVNFTEQYALLDDFASAMADTNVSAFSSDAETLNSQLADPSSRPSEAVVEVFRQLGGLLPPLKGNLSATHAMLVAWNAKYRCVNTAAFGSACNPSGGITECGGEGDGECQTGVATCVNPSLPDTPTAPGICLESSSCPGGSECTLNGEALATSAGGLEAYATASDNEDTSQYGSLSEQLDSISGSADSMPDSDSLAGDLEEIQSTIASLDVTSTRSTIADVRADADRDALGLPTVLENIDTAIDTADSFTDGMLDNVNDMLDTVDDATDTINDFRDTAEDGKQAMTVVRDYLFNQLGQDLWLLSGLSGMRAGLRSLATARAQDGTTGVLLNIANMIDRANRYLYQGSDMLDFGEDFSATPEVEERVGNILRVWEDDEEFGFGPLHWVVKLMEAAANTSTVDFDPPFKVVDGQDTSGGTVKADRNGNAWPEDRLCLTSSCFEATVTAVMAGDLSGVVGESQEAPAAPSTAFSVTFLPTIILALLALIPALCCCGRKWQACCTCCLQIGMCCQIFWVFFIVGGLWFPLVLVGSDFCATGVNVGATFVQLNAAPICESQLGGTLNEASECDVSFNLTQPVAVSLPVYDLYSALAGGSCAGKEELFSDLIAAFEGVVAGQVDDAVVDVLKMMDNSSDFEARPAVTTLIQTVGDNVTEVALQFMSDVGESVNCNSVSGVFNSAKDGVCCGLLDAGYWIVTSWYLIAFATCLCGWPAAVLGYKRFPNALWGKLHEDAEAALKNAAVKMRSQRFVDIEGDGPAADRIDVQRAQSQAARAAVAEQAKSSNQPPMLQSAPNPSHGASRSMPGGSYAVPAPQDTAGPYSIGHAYSNTMPQQPTGQPWPPSSQQPQF